MLFRSGGTGELCGAMAEGLAGAGAVTVLVGRSYEKANLRLEKISAAGGYSYFEACDAGDSSALDRKSSVEGKSVDLGGRRTL